MNWIKNLKTLALLVFAFGFLFSATLSSCGNKKNEKETTEKPAETNTSESEHPEGNGSHEHSETTEGENEHPE
ncbi:hypothetical protein QWY93_17450 [Echinicola jeungdonensis]|uniref:Lipoprotein n=1 Tax=Echinicola jeungdonensis TaxID=709343 RepID=A0ABV5J0D7_9BACT|nr:hypothetical protein [Echinicola jeungdonensis]MDN3671101.1 hypothetical protein [Echinicola jeungdonensis]